MVSAKASGALVAALAWAGLAWGQSAAPAQPTEKTALDLMTVLEAGKPGQKCLILTSWRQPEGSLAFEVQSLDTGERMTIVEMQDSTPSGGSQGMRSRIYHWGDNVTPPPGVPQPAVDQPAPPASPSASPVTPVAVPIIKSVEGLSPAPHEPPAEYQAPSGIAVSKEKTSSDISGSPLPAAKLGPIEMETAKPSDWRRSWGKADDHKSLLSSTGVGAGENVARTSAVKAPSSESAPEPVRNAAFKSAEDPAGYVNITDIPPNAKAKLEAKRSGKGLLSGILKSSKKGQEIKASAPPADASMPAVGAAQASYDPRQLQLVLEEHLMPSQREKAAEVLAAMDWRQNSDILAVILKAAAEDPAASVRAGCVRCLVTMKANTQQTIRLLQMLQADADSRVRGEADQALAAFGIQQAQPDDQPIHQIRAPADAEPK